MAFNDRDNIQNIVNEALSLASVKMKFKLIMTIVEASTEAAHVKHDHLIANQFVMKQFQNVKRRFYGSQSLQSRLLTTLGRIPQLYNQGYTMNLTEVFERTLSYFFDAPLSSTDMVFFGQDQTVMSSSTSDFQIFRAVSKKSVNFPGYNEFVARKAQFAPSGSDHDPENYKVYSVLRPPTNTPGW